MKRRSFLGALMAAPTAMPVIAQEAAAKMGDGRGAELSGYL